MKHPLLRKEFMNKSKNSICFSDLSECKSGIFQLNGQKDIQYNGLHQFVFVFLYSKMLKSKQFLVLLLQLKNVKINSSAFLWSILHGLKMAAAAQPSPLHSRQRAGRKHKFSGYRRKTENFPRTAYQTSLSLSLARTMSYAQH